MNKNTEVLVAEYDTVLNGFAAVERVLNIDFAPLIIEKQYKMAPENLAANLTKWFRGRGIPKWRDQLDLLLSRLGVAAPEDLLDKSFGLSLADQYWLKPYDSTISYDEINFFDHDFDVAEFLNASFAEPRETSSGNQAALRTPNNTTDGMLKKTWIIDGGRRYLLKGGYKGDSLQPFNEVLATMICERLGLPHVKYELGYVENTVVSKCECVTTKNTEIIPAYQVLYGEELRDGRADYNKYIEILERHGIVAARERMEDMLVLDYIIMNEDRHLNNFGVIRDVDTLRWLGAMPIFDNGQALNVLSYGDGEIAIGGEGRFFYEIDKFDNIITVVQGLKRYDFEKLDGVVEDYREMLTMNMEKANLSTARINALCAVLKGQIEKIKALQKPRK